jgi:hypothetical protein
MAAMRASARATAFGGEIELRFPFCQELVDALKELPVRSRKWDKADRVWRVQGVHAPTAIDLLLAHFPSAQVPGDAPRRRPSTPARTETPAPRPPRPPASPRSAADQAPLAPLLAVIACPRCHVRREQPIQVVAQSAEVVAKRETITPEFIAVCGNCTDLLVIGFVPAVLQVAS